MDYVYYKTNNPITQEKLQKIFKSYGKIQLTMYAKKILGSSGNKIFNLCIPTSSVSGFEANGIWDMLHFERQIRGSHAIEIFSAHKFKYNKELL